MVVSWNTFAPLDKPSVFFGRDPGHLNRVATSDVSITYPTSNTWNNHVTLTGLKPGTKYYYKVSFTGCTYVLKLDWINPGLIIVLSLHTVTAHICRYMTSSPRDQLEIYLPWL